MKHPPWRLTLLTFVLIVLFAVPGCGAAPGAAGKGGDKPMSEKAAGLPTVEGSLETADGVRLFYRKIGEGEPVLLVPNGVYLEDAFRPLARHRTVVFYDLRNRGRSAAVTDPAKLAGGIHRDVEDIEAVRRFVGAERPALLGHSYLGLAVALYALEHPDRVERLVQIGPVGPTPGKVYPAELTASDTATILDPADVGELQRRRQAGEIESQPEAFCHLWWKVMRRMLIGDPAKVELFPTGYCQYPNEWPVHMERQLRDFIGPSIEGLDVPRARWRRIDVPVLVVHGTRDRNSPYGAGRDWATLLPQARLLAVEGAGHVPWVESDAVVPAIERFLAGAWPAAAEKVGAGGSAAGSGR